MPGGIELIQSFYSSFQQRDVEGMHACYHPDVEFSDEVFPFLNGKKARAMWHMLLSGAEDAGLKINYHTVTATLHEGSCQWEAAYKFSLTGRYVVNRVHASFRFKDGLIIHHQDRFDFWRWSKMAFGFKGTLLGLTPFFKNKVRKAVDQRLEKFIERNPRYQ